MACIIIAGCDPTATMNEMFLPALHSMIPAPPKRMVTPVTRHRLATQSVSLFRRRRLMAVTAAEMKTMMATSHAASKRSDPHGIGSRDTTSVIMAPFANCTDGAT